ncbi:major facilitator superfamily transporter (pantothenate transporter liz1) [Colletotrichum tofieldiae]|uniref:Major facilitator superfamily transporter (Pantothenate transporter liz1) n=1 Tax=Colletotrichum tofieldiae TaxID=708197 RepID=A0A166QAT8_9PEZI|nr:major facilitator superfamily transporter (pantothenate transporter liz1) [Colletotrichum tofieldiae]
MDGEKKTHDVNSATSAAVSDISAGAQEDAPQNLPWKKRILYHLWDADQHLKKQWMKYIDQSNITNAYVSGMKEDLKIQGNEYTYMLMCYTIAFAIMQIPSNLIALKIRPRYCIVVCELGWTAFTFAQAAAQSSNQMYAFRFMIGLFESGFSPIIIFLLGSWYTKPELAKRVAIWHITGFFGQATSGFLQAGIHKSLNGHLGMAGWRWMYIVWWLLPDYPHNTTAWYLTEEDKQIAKQRAARQGKAEITGVVDLKLIKRMFGNWRWWVLCLMYIFYGNSCQANNYFAIYLRENGYSVTQRNVIPACANLVTMVTDFAWGFMSDMTGNRPLWIVGPLMGTTVVGSSILTAYPPTDAARVAGFFLVSCGYVTAVTWTWANEVNNGNAEERALTISSMNGLFYATNSFLPILIFPQTMAPTFERGFPSILAFALAAVVLVCIADFLHKRQLRQEAQLAVAQPVSETAVEGEGGERGEVDNKLTGAIEPVRNSSSII